MLNLQFEKDILKNSDYELVVGIDEAGRGCWAGPVGVGAYEISRQSLELKGVTDSKKISQKKRINLFTDLANHNHLILFSPPKQIDQLGISNAIELLIQKIIDSYSKRRVMFLIDGQFKKDFGKNSQKIIKGDSTYYSIAAASILVKVSRDNLMSDLSLNYPNYGFEQHKGYGTKLHVEALSRYGATSIHRMSYKPMQRFAQIKT